MLTVPPARADVGEDLYRDGHYERAIAWWREAAAGGDADAAYRLGVVHALGGADRKSGKIIIAVLVDPRHLGGFPADQGTAGHPAPIGNASDNRFGDFVVELGAGEIVEEEQRLSTHDDDVIDAHRDQIDADVVVGIVIQNQFELRPDTVGPGYQHGILITLSRQSKQASEASETADDFGA